MKPRKPFLKSNLFACLLAFAAMATFAGIVWIKTNPPKGQSKPTAEIIPIADDFIRPETIGKLTDNLVLDLKRDAMLTEWTDDYLVVFQTNFPDSTRAAFGLIVYNTKSKCLLSAVADTRMNEWQKTLWVNFAMDENLKISNYSPPFEIDEVQRMQAKFPNFRPYWPYPKPNSGPYTREEWLSAMVTSLIAKGAY